MIIEKKARIIYQIFQQFYKPVTQIVRAVVPANLLVFQWNTYCNSFNMVFKTMKILKNDSGHKHF